MSERQRSPFSRIYGYGVASVLFFHLTINVGMTIGLAPVIGIPLPFFSYGGSSLVVVYNPFVYFLETRFASFTDFEVINFLLKSAIDYFINPKYPFFKINGHLL
jgi:hypothetical protein